MNFTEIEAASFSIMIGGKCYVVSLDGVDTGLLLTIIQGLHSNESIVLTEIPDAKLIQINGTKNGN